MAMFRALAAVLILLFGLGQVARAEEVIRNFVSDLTVNADGSLDVRETITVKAEGSAIRRGIIREFPTIYDDRYGQKVRIGFTVLDIKRDGRTEPWSSTLVQNGVSVRIGDKDVFLERGDHTYTITYHTTRQLGFFDGYDELYWNVTGNGWTFPIERAHAIIRLPQGAVTERPSVYTGAFGNSGSDATITNTGSNVFAAQTTRRLEAGEGFTIAVAWQKGIVAPPSERQKSAWWIMDNMGYFLLGLTVFGVGGYYFWAWNKVGRDPPKGVIVPLFRPPEGMGPAGVRYVWKQGFDNQGFAAALVGLAVKKRLRIDDDDGDYRLTLTRGGTDPLTRTEQKLLASLPATLYLKKGNHVSVGSAQSAIEGALDDEYDGTMFLKNMKWFVVGAVLSAVGLLVAGFMAPSGEGAVVFFTTLFSSVWWGVILVIGYSVVRGLLAGRGVFSKIRSLMGLIFLVPFVGAGIAVPVMTWFGSGASWPMTFFIIGAVLLALFNFVFYWLLKAPTQQGRAVLDQIEGFRMYMTTAEEERLKVLHPPEKTPELFERYLPYAIALDCENEWNAKFAAVLAAAAAAGAVTSTAGSWYHGPGSFNSRNFGRDLSSGLSSSISSASVAPGSSSGSGGGGFSGGGGGGGGGSGW
jgi:uncharacterized membrane protein YgcG